MMHRLAIVTTHPIQYYAPWFRYLHALRELDLRVFYLWDFGVADRVDPVFGQAIRWDVPLLDGYPHEFVPNVSTRPGTDHVAGLRNPTLAARVRAFRPTAVLLQAYNYLSLYEFLLRWRRADAPLLLRGDSHRLVAATGTTARLRRTFISAVFRRMSACLYVGQANRRYFLEHGVPGSRLFFAPHAVDNARFVAAAPGAHGEARAWRAELGIPAHHRVVLFAGKFEEKKRPLDLLRAFQQADLRDASLLFVGSGPQEGELRRCAAGDARVVFAPFQNQRAMPRTYAVGDIFVLPSYGPGETWGLAVNEAMCLERPAIVSTHVGCAEDLVAPGRNGLVVEAGNVVALAGALREALVDDARRVGWGRAARARVERYSYEATAAGLLEALQATASVEGATRAPARTRGVAG
jgi:glycosyltransferase involved in cell wall biosynthesis